MDHLTADHFIIVAVCVVVAWGVVAALTPARKSSKVIDGVHPQPAARGPFNVIGVVTVVILLLWLISRSHIIPRLLHNGTAW